MIEDLWEESSLKDALRILAEERAEARGEARGDTKSASVVVESSLKVPISWDLLMLA